MRKKKVFITIFIVIIICSIIFYKKINTSNLPKGEFLSEYSSQNDTYTIKIYRCNGGATVDFAIRGELIINKTGVKKDIYWDYHVNNATVTWEDDDTVKINGKLINLPNGKYDFREDKDFDNHRHNQLSE